MKQFLNLRKKALNYLGITEQVVALAILLQNPEERELQARKILRIKPEEIAVIQHIREVGGNINAYICKRVGVEKFQDIVRLKKWGAMNKVQKIEMLCPNSESPRNFLNRVYTHFLRVKKKQKTSWKKVTARQHLLDIKTLVERMILTDEMTEKDFLELGTKVYMACYCFLKGSQKPLAEKADRILQRTEKAMAA